MPILPQYTHIINHKLKHIYLSFNKEGNLIIKSAKLDINEIEKILIKKSHWIQKSREKIKNKKGKLPNFSEENELYFLGQAYPLVLEKYEKKHAKLTFNGKIFILYYSTYNKNIFFQKIDSFYLQESKKYIPHILNKWAETMALHYEHVNFRKTTRQWGSCSSQNNLNFNTMLMKLPQNLIEYVIVHELAHIRYKHHQKDFWALVKQYLPNYKTQVQELKNYTT